MTETASKVCDLSALTLEDLGAEVIRRLDEAGKTGAPASGPIDSPRAALAALSGYARRKREHFVALDLDACHRLMAVRVISIGTLTASLVHPREVFGPAMMGHVAAVIVAHNHPSGDPTPSREDRETTRRLQEAGRILGIPVLDHLVISGRGYFSFRERGLLDA